jgi:hypothetical protein
MNSRGYMVTAPSMTELQTSRWRTVLSSVCIWDDYSKKLVNYQNYQSRSALQAR